MGGGITVQIDGGEIEREIFRLTASIPFADVVLAGTIEDQKKAGVAIARKNIQSHVYDRPQGPNTRYKRTYDLLNAVRAGEIKRSGAVVAGQIYITRAMPNFRRVYYPVLVEWGHEAGAPYEGRGYWEATKAELNASVHARAALAAKIVSAKMVK